MAARLSMGLHVLTTRLLMIKCFLLFIIFLYCIFIFFTKATRELKSLFKLETPLNMHTQIITSQTLCTHQVFALPEKALRKVL